MSCSPRLTVISILLAFPVVFPVAIRQEIHQSYRSDNSSTYPHISAGRETLRVDSMVTFHKPDKVKYLFTRR